MLIDKIVNEIVEELIEQDVKGDLDITLDSTLYYDYGIMTDTPMENAIEELITIKINEYIGGNKK